MNRSNKAILITILAMSAAGPAIAQQSGAPTSNPTAANSAMTEARQPQIKNRTNTIVGMNVNDAQGKDLGEIKDLVIDRNRAQVEFAIVSVGGVSGVAGKHIAVPWKSLQASADGKSYELNVDRDKLKDAPDINANQWSDSATAQWIEGNNSFWQGVTKPTTSSGSSSSEGESGK